jgi:hypothetical protein
VALCSGLAPLINNHFGRRALLRGRLRLHAINATALIEETVTTAAPNRGRGRFHGSFTGRLNKLRNCIISSTAPGCLGMAETVGPRVDENPPGPSRLKRDHCRAAPSFGCRQMVI